MREEANIVEQYADADTSGRIDILIKYYPNFLRLVEGYEQSLAIRYDSLRSNDAEGAVMIPLKNMINDVYAKDSGTKVLDSMNQIKALQAELDRCEDLRMKNIERLNTGDMSKDDYLSERDALNAKVEDLKRRLMECQSWKQEAETVDDPEVQRFLDASSKYKGQQELTNDMVKAFIESVLIYDPERIEIK